MEKKKIKLLVLLFKFPFQSPFLIRVMTGVFSLELWYMMG